MYDFATGAPPVEPDLAFNVPDSSEPVRVVWMSGGRAWAGWRGLNDPLTDDVVAAPGPHLTQLGYSAASGLTNLGDVRLSAMVDAVYDTGVYTVAATPSSVVVIAPTCR